MAKEAAKPITSRADPPTVRIGAKWRTERLPTSSRSRSSPRVSAKPKPRATSGARSQSTTKLPMAGHRTPDREPNATPTKEKTRS